MRLILLPCGLLFALVLWGCDPSSDTPPPTDQTPPLVTPPTSTPGVTTLSATGGTVTLPSKAEINFPAGAVPTGTRVEVKDVSTPLSDPDFVAEAAMMKASNIASRSTEVVVSGAQPSSNVSVKLFVPSTYVSNLPAGQKTRVLALSSNESDLESPSATYLIVTVTVNASDSSVSFLARPEFFAFESAGNHIARFVMATSP